MVKPSKTIIYNIQFIVFLGLCLVFSSTLYSAQTNGDDKNAPQYVANHTKRAKKKKSGTTIVSYKYKRGHVLPPDYICHKCGMPGHWIEQCKSKVYRNKKPPPHYVCHKCGIAGHWVNKCKATNRMPYPPDDYICNKCGQPGHFIAFCPRKQHYNPPSAALKPSNLVNLSQLLNYQNNHSQYNAIRIIDTSNGRINVEKINLPPYDPQCGNGHIGYQQLPQSCALYVSKSKNPYDIWSCASIKTCKAFSTVISCLQYWHRCENTQSLANIFIYLHRSNKYMHIVGAYHHLLDIHLNASNKRDDYSYINQKVCQAVQCDFGTCKSYIRNQRERLKEAHKANPNNRKEYIFLRDLLDTIHVYLVHGADAGYRYMEGNKYFSVDKPLSDDEKNESENDLYIDGCSFDYEMQAVKAWKGNGIKKQPNLQASQNKFQTNINEIKKPYSREKISLDALKLKFGNKQIAQKWMRYLKDNECDTDNILEQIEEESSSVLYDKFPSGNIKRYIKQAEADVRPVAYGFGIRLYYWEYYKTSTEHDDWHRPAIPYKDLYVAPMYLSFKNEMLAKKGISINIWNQKIYEADAILLQSVAFKKIKASVPKPTKCSRYRSARYGISHNSHLTIYHILSVVFYTNFPSLYTNFSRTFRYLSYSESLQDVIKRNSKWHYLAKYLREVVEVFGERIAQEEISKRRRYCDKGSFYHGLSNVLFPQYTVCFYGPLSTSKQLAVAVRFTESTGTVLELKQGLIKYAIRLRYFNVSLASCFAVEDERLFMGGKYRMCVASMHTLKDNIHTKRLMHALFLIHKGLNGGYLGKNNMKFKKSDIALTKRLLSSSSGLQPYAQKIWTVFKDTQRRVEVDMPWMQNADVLFFKLLFSSNPRCKNLLLFDKIVSLFPNVTKIVCKGVDYKGPSAYAYLPSIVSSTFILGVKECLSRMDKNAKLEIIIIKTDKYKIKDDCKLFVEGFSKLGWDIKKEHDEPSRPWKPLYNQFSTIVLKRKSKIPLLHVPDK